MKVTLAVLSGASQLKEATTKYTKHTKNGAPNIGAPFLFFGFNSPRDESASLRKLFPLRMQFFVAFVPFVVASSKD